MPSSEMPCFENREAWGSPGLAGAWRVRRRCELLIRARCRPVRSGTSVLSRNNGWAGVSGTLVARGLPLSRRTGTNLESLYQVLQIQGEAGQIRASLCCLIGCGGGFSLRDCNHTNCTQLVRLERKEFWQRRPSCSITQAPIGFRENARLDKRDSAARSKA